MWQLERLWGQTSFSKSLRHLPESN